MPLSSPSPRGAQTVNAFEPAHIPLLTLISACAMQCSQYRSTEECLDALFATPVMVSSDAVGAPPARDAGSPMTTLSALYPEVRVLECAHRVRSTLRKLHECPPHATRDLYELVHKHLTVLYDTVPDPLFGALAQATHAQLADDAHPSSNREERHLLATQTLQVVEKLQREVLTQSRRLTTRCTTLTLRYRNQVPF